MSCNSQLMKTNVTSGLVTTLWYWDITSKKFGAGSFYQTPVRLNSVSGPLCARRPHKKTFQKIVFMPVLMRLTPGFFFLQCPFQTSRRLFNRPLTCDVAVLNGPVTPLLSLKLHIRLRQNSFIMLSTGGIRTWDLEQSGFKVSSCRCRSQKLSVGFQPCMGPPWSHDYMP